MANFFSTFFGIKSQFWLEGVRIRQCVFITLVTHQLKHCHELIHGFTIHDTLFTFIRVQKELTGHGIDNTACQVLVLHGVRLITCILYTGYGEVSTVVLGNRCGVSNKSIHAALEIRNVCCPIARLLIPHC